MAFLWVVAGVQPAFSQVTPPDWASVFTANQVIVVHGATGGSGTDTIDLSGGSWVVYPASVDGKAFQTASADGVSVWLWNEEGSAAILSDRHVAVELDGVPGGWGPLGGLSFGEDGIAISEGSGGGFISAGYAVVPEPAVLSFFVCGATLLLRRSPRLSR